jgi:hypothetical protein
MSNSQLEAQLSDSKRRRTNDLIRMGNLVKSTVESAGWTEVGLPLLTKMAADVLGKISGKVWHGGLINKDKKEDNALYYIGYKQALIDYHNRLYAYVKNIKLAEGALKIMDEEEKETYTVPMLNEGSGY